MKTTGTSIAYERNLLQPGDLFLNICGNRISKFSHFKDGNTNIVVDTNGISNGISNLRWLTDIEYSEYMKENKTTMKTSGQFLTEAEFLNLNLGDLFVNVKRNNNIFKFHSRWIGEEFNKICSDSNGAANSRKNMRWPTNTEYTNYCQKRSNQSETNNTTKKETETMSNTSVVATKSNLSTVQNAYAVVKSDGTEAAWRVAAKQAAKSVRAPVVAALQKTTLPTGVVAFLVSQLDTDNGEAVLSFVLGTVIGYVPQLGNDPKFVRLAKELRILGMDRFLSKVADVMLNPLREQLVEIVKAIPFETPAV